MENIRVLFIHSFIHSFIFIVVCLLLQKRTGYDAVPLKNLLIIILLLFVAECKSTQYKCKDGTCLEGTKVCNKIPDCSDGDDEKNCTARWWPQPFLNQPIQKLVYSLHFSFFMTYCQTSPKLLCIL